MNPKGYLIFHLNLAFPSIEEEARPDVMSLLKGPVCHDGFKRLN